MAVLYWNGTKIQIHQYDKAEVVCGEFSGTVGYVNYTWASGQVDLISKIPGRGAFDEIVAPKHYYIRDYKCLEQR